MKGMWACHSCSAWVDIGYGIFHVYTSPHGVVVKDSWERLVHDCTGAHS